MAQVVQTARLGFHPQLAAKHFSCGEPPGAGMTATRADPEHAKF